MFELLRDPLWQFVGAILALFALIVSVVSVMVYRNRKRLTYEVVLNPRLLSVDEEIEGRVKITFDGYPVRGVRMLIVHVRNSGNVPIEESDYESNLGFWVKGGPKVLTAEVVETKPPDIRAHVEAMENTVYLDKMLLNPGDALALKLLYTGDGPLIPVGRIKGVSEIKEKKRRNYIPFLMAAAFATGVPLLLGSAFGGEVGKNSSAILALAGLLLIAVIAVRVIRGQDREPSL